MEQSEAWRRFEDWQARAFIAIFNAEAQSRGGNQCARLSQPRSSQAPILCVSAPPRFAFYWSGPEPRYCFFGELPGL